MFELFDVLFHISEEALRRREIFNQNLALVRQGQLNFANGLTTYDLRINSFADLTFDEFGALWTGQGQLAGPDDFIDPSIVPVTKRIIRSRRRQFSQLSASLDWNEMGKTE